MVMNPMVESVRNHQQNCTTCPSILITWILIIAYYNSAKLDSTSSPIPKKIPNPTTFLGALFFGAMHNLLSSSIRSFPKTPGLRSKKMTGSSHKGEFRITLPPSPCLKFDAAIQPHKWKIPTAGWKSSPIFLIGTYRNYIFKWKVDF